MLNAREKFQLVVLDQLGEGIIVTDADGRIVMVNRAAEEIHGRVKLDVPPDAYSVTYELLTMDDEPYPPEELPLAQAVMHGRTIVDAPWKIRRPDGSVIVAVGSARPVLDEKKAQIGSVLTMRDDTFRHDAEMQLKEALHLKEVLLFEVNHRVRNSLQIVSSIVSLPLQTVTDPQAREALQQTRQRIDVISSTHRSLYELGTHDRVDCNRLLPELSRQVIDTYDIEGRITFECQTSGTVILPVGKAVSLCLAVTEMITNSCKYAFEGRDHGTVGLAMDGTGEEITITVSDDGVGIGADEEPASGIGTLLINSLTRSLGTPVERQSGADGTRFIIRFPKQVERMDEDHTAFNPNSPRATLI